MEYRTEIEEKVKNLVDKYTFLLAYKASNKEFDKKTYDRLLSDLNLINEASGAINDTLLVAYQSFLKDELLDVRNLLALFFLKVKLSDDVLKLALFVDENFLPESMDEN